MKRRHFLLGSTAMLTAASLPEILSAQEYPEWTFNCWYVEHVEQTPDGIAYYRYDHHMLGYWVKWQAPGEDYDKAPMCFISCQTLVDRGIAINWAIRDLQRDVVELASGVLGKAGYA